MPSRVLGILPSGHYTDLLQTFTDSGWEISVFQPEQAEQSGAKVAIERLRTVTTGGRLVKQIIDWTVTTGVCALVSLDNNPIVSAIWRYLEIPIFVVQHGVRITQLQRRPLPVSRHIHFLSWGTLQQEDQESGKSAIWPNALHKVQPSRVKPVGSLRDSISANLTIGEMEQPKSPEADICLISQFKGREPRELHHWRKRQRAIETVTRWTGRFVEDRNLKLVIAGYSDTESTCREERRWLGELVLSDFEFVSPRTATSTFWLTQSSRLTIGVHSSALWEAFARQRQVLAVNPVSGAPFSFPIDGIWSLKSENYADFQTRVTHVLNSPPNDYAQAACSHLDRVALVRPGESVELRIRRYIEEILGW